MGIILVIIVLSATLIGSICGMGGGVIIKPLLDAISPYTAFQISIISTTAVLSMSIASLIKHAIAKRKINIKLALLLSIGAVLGSILGDFSLKLINDHLLIIYGIKEINYIKIIQNLVLCIIMILVLIYMLFIKKRNIHFNVKNNILKLVVGFILGFISNFLDIGGPMNICVIVLFFGISSKDASIVSIFIILFSKIAKFTKLFINQAFYKNELFNSNLTIYIFLLIILFAVLGGIIGASINKKIDEKYVSVTYCTAISLVIFLSLYNIINNIILLQ